ncbi:MAG: hypothetical protein U1E72_03665 [Burkholderiaceae bacterium]
MTDRQELDDQIAGTFAATGALTKDIKQAQAQSRAHLRELLAGQGRYVFTADPQVRHRARRGDSGAERPARHHRHHRRGAPQPVRPARRQHAASRCRTSLHRLHRHAADRWAGRAHARCSATTCRSTTSRSRWPTAPRCPLYYEARKPELQLADADTLRDDLDELLDAAMLDDEQEKKLQREFARQYHLITREDRLDQMADLACHFAARGYLGKAMFVAIDKATAVRMHDKFRVQWAALLAEHAQRVAATPPEARAAMAERLAWMRAGLRGGGDQGQNEIAELKAKGLDILPRRKRMQEATWRRSSRTRTTRCGWCSCARCGSPTSTCPPATRCTWTSR